MNELDKKEKKLREIIEATGGLAVAFSGGVDSTFLAAVTKDVLGDRALAVTAMSPTYPERERDESKELASEIGISQILVDSNELEIDGFSENPVDRCYFCKKELFQVVYDIASEHGIDHIADGSNADDTDDYRPGRKAAAELDVMSPLLEAGLGKEDIRELSRRINLRTSEKPAFACLASRFPYGTEITAEKLSSVELIEMGIRDMGYGQVRVRHHGDIVRIEFDPSEIERAASEKERALIVALAKRAGFQYIAIDLEGYRTGSMNEVIDTES